LNLKLFSKLIFKYYFHGLQKLAFSMEYKTVEIFNAKEIQEIIGLKRK
jgi:hypothetical protein